jgi:PEP-CTERM motif
MRTIATITLALAFAAPPAHARQVLLVPNISNNTVGEYNAVTGATINANFINGQGLNNPDGLALDANNHLFVSNRVAPFFGGPPLPGSVGEYDATTGATINAPFIQGLNYPHQLALDANNHLFVAINGNNAIGEYDATTGATINPAFVSLNPALNSPLGIALDRNNHLFAVSQNSPALGGVVGEYDATTGATINASFISLGSNRPFGLALDALNHILVTDATGGTVAEYDATTGATINATFINGLSSPIGLALDGNNHLFVANQGNNTVGEYDATTGATINATFINGQGLSTPRFLLFVPAVPEPSSMLMLAGAAVAGLWRCRNRPRWR